jgi:hypothetical protein
MIRNTTPQLDAARIDQMISTALSYKQQAKRNRINDMIDYIASPLRFSIGASLVAATIVGIMWINPTSPPILNSHQLTQAANEDEISDIMLYNLVEDLSADQT